MAYRELMDEWGENIPAEHHEGFGSGIGPYFNREIEDKYDNSSLSPNDPNYWLYVSKFKRNMQDPEYARRAAGHGSLHFTGEAPQDPPYIF
jgi:hypothetical protein